MISYKQCITAFSTLIILLFFASISYASVQYTVNVITPSGMADDDASADIPLNGTVTGNYTHTHASDDIYESIQEMAITKYRPTGRKSYLEHKWIINVTSANKASVTFNVEAYHTPNSENDHFVFAYSLDDIDYYDMVTVTGTSDNDNIQTFEMPDTVNGTVYIMVRDTDRTPGNTIMDTIYIDRMFIRSLLAEPLATETSDSLTVVGSPGKSTGTSPGPIRDFYHYISRLLVGR